MEQAQNGDKEEIEEKEEDKKETSNKHDKKDDKEKEDTMSHGEEEARRMVHPAVSRLVHLHLHPYFPI